MNLEDIQNDFIDAFFNKNLKDAAVHVKSDDTLTAEQRVGIYRGSVHGILTKTLEQTFPVCKMLVGEQFFDKITSVFIDQYPPTTTFFADFGGDMPTFLDNFEPAKSVPFLADMAKLEWFRKVAWSTPLQETSDFSKLAEIPESDQANLIFKLAPSLQLFESSYRIDHIWFAHQPESEIELEQIAIDEPIKLAVWKTEKELALHSFEFGFETDETSIEKNQAIWNFLHDVSENKNLGQLAASYAENLPVCLSMSIQNSWLQSYSLPKSS